MIRPGRLAGVACLLLAGCQLEQAAPDATYLVREHDTLYSIAWRYRLDYHDLARWNGIGTDYRIRAGQVLELGPPASPASPARLGARASAAPRSPAAERPAAKAIAECREEGGAGAAERWVWPTVPTSAPESIPSGGVLLRGRIDQPVRAACAGRIVYLGSGLRAYGTLLIIKHGENVLTAYAHIRAPTVHEGEPVRSGEIIAAMGEGPHQVPALYFEIRVNGRPVDPLRHLGTAP